jgi:hypothetical protein
MQSENGYDLFPGYQYLYLSSERHVSFPNVIVYIEQIYKICRWNNGILKRWNPGFKMNTSFWGTWLDEALDRIRTRSYFIIIWIGYKKTCTIFILTVEPWKN